MVSDQDLSIAFVRFNKFIKLLCYVSQHQRSILIIIIDRENATFPKLEAFRTLNTQFIMNMFFFDYGNADIPKFGKLHFCWYLIKWSIYGRETSGCLVTWVYHNTNLNKNKKTLNKKEIDAKVTLFTSGFSIFSKFKKYSPKPFFRQPFGQWAFENVMGYSRNGGPWKDMDANVTVTVNLFFC